MSYLYHRVQDSQQEPTLADVLKQAIWHKSDRVSLVCEPDKFRPAAICVLLLDNRAMADITSVLIQAGERAGTPKPDQRLEINLTDSAKFIFQWLVDNEIPWTTGMFRYKGKRVMLFAIIGNEVCESLAHTLTNLGCPTSIR